MNICRERTANMWSVQIGKRDLWSEEEREGGDKTKEEELRDRREQIQKERTGR